MTNTTTTTRRNVVPFTALMADKVVFCVGQTALAIQTFEHAARNAGLAFKPVLGSYKGTEERAYIMDANNWRFIAPFVRDEESVLLLGAKDARGNRRATLHYVDTGREEELGAWHKVTEARAMKSDAWTYDNDNDAYYLADTGNCQTCLTAI